MIFDNFNLSLVIRHCDENALFVTAAFPLPDELSFPIWNKVMINVGGVKFTTSRETLTSGLGPF
jgi:hypothetical protein